MIATFKDLVLADLRRAQRLIERVRDEIDPQFRIASPEGDYWIAMTLGDDPTERTRRMALLSDFIALKCSPAFVLATEITEPDAVVAIGASHAERWAVLSHIYRGKPLRFGADEWLDEGAVGDELWSLLPRGTRQLNQERIVEIEALFGDSGQFPALRIA
jgi:hypothetical protein